MSLFSQLARVRAAKLEMNLARQEMSPPAAALLARGQRYPLTTVGTAAGAGFVLGTLNVHPLRIPGLGSLLGGGLAEAVAYGTRLVSELGAFGLGGGADSGRTDSDKTDSDDTAAPDTNSGQSS
jgi:hypothetical protein